MISSFPIVHSPDSSPVRDPKSSQPPQVDRCKWCHTLFWSPDSHSQVELSGTLWVHESVCTSRIVAKSQVDVVDDRLPRSALMATDLNTNGARVGMTRGEVQETLYYDPSLKLAPITAGNLGQGHPSRAPSVPGLVDLGLLNNARARDTSPLKKNSAVLWNTDESFRNMAAAATQSRPPFQPDDFVPAKSRYRFSTKEELLSYANLGSGLKATFDAVLRPE
ncbi:hypothetical protein GALMADRAFT_136334 [Galerina marginata CBS 339.88]|uniref:Uncharacterized protein n=1 Tax=Galerina marginata (strain CBS 339.88) TaxID=685588 RepID=A0A067TDT7_GALM3|nr:hypothetical protein GALMADRAFT_136334 [Galerina marginata CBS 339.88]